MTLTPEERNALFETITNEETIEARAEAILQIRNELEEQSNSLTETQTAFDELQSKYNDSQTTMKNLLNSLPQQTEQTNEQNNEPPQQEKFGFAKLKP